ncbi:hypothetical protein EQ500_07705, partial [Lactobacillus sp. XV13L]|nr:hypothetical protein [Lactobacillus sp. XV13L]
MQAHTDSVTNQIVQNSFHVLSSYNNSFSNFQSRSLVPAFPNTGDYALETNPDGQATAYVKNSKQFLHAVYGDNNGNVVHNTGIRRAPTTITKIVLCADIDIPNTSFNPRNPQTDDIYLDGKLLRFDGAYGFTGAFGSYSGMNRYRMDLNRVSDKLILDGQDPITGTNHFLNLGNMSLTTSNVRDARPLTATIQNMVIYGTSYYGIIDAINGETKENFDNVTYYGSQLLWSRGNVDIKIKNKVTAYSLNSYIGPDHNEYTCFGNGRQQNIEAHNITFTEGCNYY